MKPYRNILVLFFMYLSIRPTINCLTYSNRSVRELTSDAAHLSYRDMFSHSAGDVSTQTVTHDVHRVQGHPCVRHQPVHDPGHVTTQAVYPGHCSLVLRLRQSRVVHPHDIHVHGRQVR